MKRFALILVGLVAGCATNAKLQANLNSLMHEDIGRAVSWLGRPVNVFQVNADEKIYTFQNNGQVVLPGQVYTTPVTSRTTGYINNAPYTANTTTYVPQQGAPTVVNLSCTINITTRYDLVINWQANGNHCVSR